MVLLRLCQVWAKLYPPSVPRFPHRQQGDKAPPSVLGAGFLCSPSQLAFPLGLFGLGFLGSSSCKFVREPSGCQNALVAGHGHGGETLGMREGGKRGELGKPLPSPRREGRDLGRAGCGQRGAASRAGELLLSSHGALIGFHLADQQSALGQVLNLHKLGFS